MPANRVSWGVHALLLQDLIPVANVTFPFWSIAVEWHVYLLLPAIALLRRYSSWPVAVGLAATIGALGMGVAALITDEVARLHPEYYLLFAIAAGACVLVSKSPAWTTKIPWLGIAVGLAANFLGIVSIQGPSWAYRHQPAPDLLVGLSVLSLLISMGLEPGTVAARLFSWRPLVFVGAFAYSIYLVHSQLLRASWVTVIEPMAISPVAQATRGFGVVVPALIGASWIFYCVAERPFVRYTPRSSSCSTREP